jgi:hypothetical protein
MTILDLEIPVVEVGDILTNEIKFYTVKKISGSGLETVVSLMGISGTPLEEPLVSMLEHGYKVRGKGAQPKETAASATDSGSHLDLLPPPQSDHSSEEQALNPEASERLPVGLEAINTGMQKEAVAFSASGSGDSKQEAEPSGSVRRSVQQIIDDLKKEEEENIERIRKKTAEKIFKAAQKAQSPSEKRKEALEKMDLMREKIRAIEPFMLDADVDQKIMLAIDAYVSSISDNDYTTMTANNEMETV